MIEAIKEKEGDYSLWGRDEYTCTDRAYLGFARRDGLGYWFRPPYDASPLPFKTLQDISYKLQELNNDI